MRLWRLWALTAAVPLVACTRPGPVPPGPTPVRTPLAMAEGNPEPDLPSARSLAWRGEVVYRALCLECHGGTGRGDGPAALLLRRPPRDFRDRERARRQSPAWYYRAIADGVTGTGMPAWSHRLDEATTWDTAYYVWSWFLRPGELARGQDLYEASCASCHGPDGRLEPTARLDDAARARLSLDEAVAELVAAHGGLLAELTADDRAALAAHMATFLFAPTAGGGP